MGQVFDGELSGQQSSHNLSPTHALLGLLVRGEQYGYELKRIVDDEFDPFWRIDFGQLYRSLARMTRAGWITARVEPGERGPARKVYTLTAPGRQVLMAWLAQPARSRDEFFVKLRLAAETNIPVADLIDSQRNLFEEERRARSQAHRAAQKSGEAGPLILTYAALGESEASLAALDLSEAVLPTRGRKMRSKTWEGPLAIAGSDDPLLARLALMVRTSTHPVGSMGGLLALSQHQTQVAGIHLLDVETGEYNIPFVRHFLPEDDVVLVNLAFRENGLMIARGNPKNIRALRDLTRRDVRLINRARGTGTRLLLYSKLRAAHIDPHSLRGWERTVATHDAVAGAIATGAADVGPGLYATAALWGLDFYALGEERYDLVMPQCEFASARLRPMLAALHSAEFKKAAASFQGYDLTRSGQVIAHVK